MAESGGIKAPRFLAEGHYRKVFDDLGFWRPYVDEIARRHEFHVYDIGFPPGDRSNPVFYVGDAIVVKIFTPFFRGRESRDLERAAMEELQDVEEVPTPYLLAAGELDPSSDWPWPYIVTSRAKGTPLDTTWRTTSQADKIKLAADLGKKLKEMHSIKPSPGLSKVWHARWNTGFGRFLEWRQEQVVADPKFAELPLWDELVALRPQSVGAGVWPSLLHGDLEEAHLFHKGTEITEIIDFGDAKLGDPIYDFVTVHLFLLDRQAPLLEAFYDSYGYDPKKNRQEFLKKAMNYTFFHEWSSHFVEAFNAWITVSGARSVYTLTEWMWFEPLGSQRMSAPSTKTEELPAPAVPEEQPPAPAKKLRPAKKEAAPEPVVAEDKPVKKARAAKEEEPVAEPPKKPRTTAKKSAEPSKKAPPKPVD